MKAHNFVRIDPEITNQEFCDFICFWYRCEGCGTSIGQQCLYTPEFIEAAKSKLKERLDWILTVDPDCDDNLVRHILGQ